MNKRLLSLMLAALLALSGCSARAEEEGPKRYEASFLTLFDTVTTVVGYAWREEDFRVAAQELHDQLLEYHRLFDIYNSYEGVSNLKTVNDGAGGAAVQVDRRIVDLLLFCRELYEDTGGRVNVVLGSVLSLWHEARNAGVEDPEHAALPGAAALAEAGEHTGFDALVIDEAASTVRLTDPAARLDVGAVAKGYIADRMKDYLTESGVESAIINLGGNVLCVGGLPDGTDFHIGLQKPFAGRTETFANVAVNGMSVVSSGVYERHFELDGVNYHHLLDPKTGYPYQNGLVSVTILSPRSVDGDALSTTCFSLGLEDGMALLDSIGDVCGIFVTEDGEIYYSEGAEEYVEAAGS